jgi:glycosyltransferase 2 family protein
VAILLAAAIFGLVLLMRAGPAGARSAPGRIRTAVARDIREGLIARRSWMGVALTSALVVAGHVATFLIAARTAGVAAPPSRMLPIVLLVMLVTALPGMGVWGSREGAAAWLFSAAGLGARAGVTTGVVYAVMMLVASLPGAAVLAVAWFRSRGPSELTEPPLRRSTAHA